MSLKSYIKRGLQYIAHGIPTVSVSANITYTSPDNKLKGKNIVITGGGRGLGLAMAKKFISEGAKILISGRNEETLRKVSEELGCQYIVYDVCDAEKAEDFMKSVDRMLGGVNVLVNNAGISLHEWVIDAVTVDKFDRQINTNLRGGYFLTKYFVEILKDNNRTGNVLFMSSERGEQTDDIPYGLTKAAINSFVKGIAPEIIKYGIRINAVAPGITASDMTGWDANGNLYYRGNPNNRIYLPEEVAEVAAFLVSDISSCVSGQIIVCNDGKTGNSRHMYK